MQTVTAPVAKISFAVPKEWVVVTEATAKDPAVLKKLEPMAKLQSVSPQKLAENYMSLADSVALDPSDSSRFTSNLNSLKITRSSLPTADQYKSELSKVKAVTGKFSHVTSPAGAGEEQEYTLPVMGKTLHGVSICLPNGSGSYSTVTVSSLDADTSAKIAKDVVDSVHKL